MENVNKIKHVLRVPFVVIFTKQIHIHLWSQRLLCAYRIAPALSVKRHRHCVYRDNCTDILCVCMCVFMSFSLLILFATPNFQLSTYIVYRNIPLIPTSNTPSFSLYIIFNANKLNSTIISERVMMITIQFPNVWRLFSTLFWFPTNFLQIHC